MLQSYKQVLCMKATLYGAVFLDFGNKSVIPLISARLTDYMYSDFNRHKTH